MRLKSLLRLSPSVVCSSSGSCRAKAALITDHVDETLVISQIVQLWKLVQLPDWEVIDVLLSSKGPFESCKDSGAGFSGQRGHEMGYPEVLKTTYYISFLLSL